jgi:hypothetical protein
MSERTWTRAEVVHLLGRIQQRTGWSVVAQGLDLEPELRLTPSTFDVDAAAAKRPSGIQPAALHDADPALPVPTPHKPSER